MKLSSDWMDDNNAMKASFVVERSVSIVISTLNRANVLSKALRSLKYQNYSNFEVVVVNGPSTDGTQEVLDQYRGDIVIARLDEANLSKSRNIGIRASSGELVLFLDDDAFAEPDWISNIVAGYEKGVGGVGTRVWDHTGFQWQMNPFLIDRFYKPNFDAKPPLWAFEYTDSKTIPHILGASSSFSREALMTVGGFDEEIEYFLDESEVCRRVVEAGYKIRFVNSGASVLHKFASGVTRDERKILTYPYPVVKNKYYVTLSDWRRTGGSLSERLEACDAWLKELLDGASWQLRHQGISRAEYDRFVADARRGQADGRARAIAQERKSVAIEPAKPKIPTKFSTFSPTGGRKTFCFISRWTPERSPGGIARYIYDLASGFADRGHEVHLICGTDGPAHVDYVDGIWIRSLPDAELGATPVPNEIREVYGDIESGAARTNIAWARAAHAEVLRIRNDRYVDLVMAPTWDQEGLFCVLDRSLNTVVSINTTFRRYSEIEWKNLDSATLRELTALENIYLGRAHLFHYNSRASAKYLETAFGRSRDRGAIVPHGAPDIEPAALVRSLRNKSDVSSDRVRILYVSRLERRKGTDLLLDAAVRLLKQRDEIEFLIVGRDAYAQDPRRSYAAQFQAAHPELEGKVQFLGQLSDDEVAELREAADIFCVPSRYESFGIIYVEAMRYALPVVALAAGGVTDIVVDGETGLLCTDETGVAIERALTRLIDNPVERRAMGAAGRARFESHFEHNVVADAAVNAFTQLATNRFTPSVSVTAHAA